SGEKNRESDHPEPGALCGDLVFIPRPTEHMEKENTVQDLERPQGSEEAGEDEESESAGNEENGEERPNNDEGDGALHDSAFAIARSATAMDRRGNDHSSIKSSQGTEREVSGRAMQAHRRHLAKATDGTKIS
ncbi:Hypothetical protein SMAX5B_010961, partial [Scophthalmus maximus]